MVAGSSPVSVAIKKPCFSRENRAFFVLLWSQFLFGVQNPVQNFSSVTLFRSIQAVARSLRHHVWTNPLGLASCISYCWWVQKWHDNQNLGFGRIARSGRLRSTENVTIWDAIRKKQSKVLCIDADAETTANG